MASRTREASLTWPNILKLKCVRRRDDDEKDVFDLRVDEAVDVDVVRL